MKCASFFSGVGGIDLGFKLGGNFVTVYANDFDPYPSMTFEKNFPIKVDVRSIVDVTFDQIPKDIDIVMGGFPCQAFSIAGYQQGFDDKKGRGNLFFEMSRLIKDIKPRVVFLENVKNLVGHDNGKTFNTIIKTLDDIGYKNPIYGVLNAMDYGNIPQNRERIYIVAFRDENDRRFFKMPDPIERTKTIHDIIDFKNKVNSKYYYTNLSCKETIYNEIKKDVNDKNAIYQWRRRYVRKNKSGVVPTLTANMGEGGHNVPIILSDSGIRKLTPKECFSVQGFPETFVLPDIADSKLYKQAGNSVCVTVVSRIASAIETSLNISDQLKSIKKSKKNIPITWIQDYLNTVSDCDKKVIIDLIKKYNQKND